jgi:hypothetical protein
MSDASTIMTQRKNSVIAANHYNNPNVLTVKPLSHEVYIQTKRGEMPIFTRSAKNVTTTIVPCGCTESAPE